MNSVERQDGVQLNDASGDELTKLFINPRQNNPLRLKSQIVLATHHKAGTVLIQDIFKRISALAGLRFYNLITDDEKPDLNEVDFIFDWHSSFKTVDFAVLRDVRGIHTVRDPRNLVISAVHYHARSDEAWLHQPLGRFGGMTYQEKLLSIDSFEKRLIFELEQDHFTESGGRTIQDMVDWVRREMNWCMDVRLEALMTDVSMELYGKIMDHLRFPEDLRSVAINVAFDNSVFNPSFNSQHARSRDVEEWRHYFSKDLKNIFRSRFGDAVEELGYSW